MTWQGREPIVIQKARRPSWKGTRTRARSEALARTMGSAVRVDILRGIQRFKKKIDPELVYQAWLSKDYSKIFTSMPWKDLPGELDPVANSLTRAGFEAGRISMKALPAPVSEGLRYDVENPRIANFFSRQTGNMILGIQEDAQAVIRTQVQRSFTEARNPREVAEEIKGSIGLLPQHEVAVRNFARGLQDKNYSLQNIEAKSNDYADRLLDYRARMIARTEIQNATNYGQLYVWQEAQNQDLIGAGSRKVWVVDGDPCEICLKMDGIAVPIEGMWVLSNGDTVEVPSESHPHCFCLMELEIGGPTDEPTEYNHGYEED